MDRITASGPMRLQHVFDQDRDVPIVELRLTQAARRSGRATGMPTTFCPWMPDMMKASAGTFGQRCTLGSVPVLSQKCAP